MGKFLSLTLALFFYGSTSFAQNLTQNLVRADQPSTIKKIGNESVTFEVKTAGQIQAQFGDPKSTTVLKNPNSLILGYPLNLLKKESVFGGVITKVSNKDNENLGILKLSDLTPLHVKTDLVKDASGAMFLVLFGCPFSCNETSKDEMLIGFPVVGVDPAKNLAYVDLAQIGQDLDIVGLLGASEYFKLSHVQSQTTTFDFNDDTLIFDVESLYRITGKLAEEKNTATQSLLTTRYYLKLNPKYTEGYQARSPVGEVGYFTTNRAAEPKITRFHATPNDKVKYYVKNVPAEYQRSFKAAFDQWNATFQKILGHSLLEYEFVNQNDPLNDVLVAGDVRYNILEWDLVNIATYGGLGPSVANQVTGELLSANVLIQGPTIVRLYTEWFSISKDIELLLAAGDKHSADQLQRNFERLLVDTLKGSPVKHRIRLGRLDFRIPAEDPAFQDEAVRKLEFEIIPEGFTYETYMYGYFQEMVAHELGHNLGLRHNFRGNLGSDDSMNEGTVSRSIMEYLGRGFRHMNRIADYDHMAISYGYRGDSPTVSNWFCTDENVPSEQNLLGSAECSRDDATSDPFSFFESRLVRARDLVLNKGSSEIPVWSQSDIESAFNGALNGLALYAASAPFTAQQWTNFFGKVDRPSAVADVSKYVAEKLNAIICDPSLINAVEEKATVEAKQKTLHNLSTFQQQASNKLVKYNGVWEVFNKDNITCLVESE